MNLITPQPRNGPTDSRFEIIMTKERTPVLGRNQYQNSVTVSSIQIINWRSRTVQVVAYE